MFWQEAWRKARGPPPSSVPSRPNVIGEGTGRPHQPQEDLHNHQTEPVSASLTRGNGCMGRARIAFHEFPAKLSKVEGKR